jgi:hypothetical protein
VPIYHFSFRSPLTALSVTVRLRIRVTSDVEVVSGSYARNNPYNMRYIRPILRLLAVALSKANPFNQSRYTRQTKGWLHLTGLSITQLEVIDIR